MLHICCLGILSQGSWKLFSDLKDLELKDLTDRLPVTILNSRANSTVKKYLGAYRRWKIWAIPHNLNPVPARPHEFILYLQHLDKVTTSKAAVEEAHNALSWVHASPGLLPITLDPFVKATLEGLQWILASPVVKKEPITTDQEMLEAIAQEAKSSGSLSDLRLATAWLLGFVGFFHFDELINLQPCDFELQAEMMAKRIVCSKTDQLRQVDRVVVARTGTPTCSVAMLEQYITRTAMPLNDDRFLFRTI